MTAQRLATIVFAGSALYVLYILFGYPLVLGWLAKRGERPVRKQPYFPSVSILLAVHNGAAFIVDKLRSIAALHYPAEKIEILVLSDGSTDATEKLARDFGDARVKVIPVPRSGKAGALNEGIRRASGEVFVFTDVRQQLDPDSLKHLTANLADSTVGAVSAELIIRKGATSEEANTGLYWKYEIWIRDQLSRIDSIFGATGALYAIRRELVRLMPPGTLVDDMHIPLFAFFQGYRLVVDRAARMYDQPTALHSEFWRKTRTLAGNYQILAAYPQLLRPRNRMWFHFVSYKFGRLLMPFAMIAAAVSAWWMPAPWGSIAVILQAVFYAIALLDFVLPEGTMAKRLTSPARTFVVLMAATIWALSIFFVPSGRLWKVAK
jgi:cellulose synthase/poly-beta-1,6-N-acetylglucosamine synthase-like glycosyltransferase